jgi:hypothetical protein
VTRAHPTPSPRLRILVLDLDDVLIQQVAYHQSLKDCVEMVGRWCGFPAVQLTDEDVAVFEAQGVTSEWDSSAICAALLLERAWQVDPGRALPDSPAASDGHYHGLPSPDFQAFFRPAIHGRLSGPEARAETELRLLAGREHTPGQTLALHSVLRSAYHSRTSLTHRIIQELNLGAATFEACYGVPAALPGPGYLNTIDPPLISPETAAKLLAWTAAPGTRAVVFTNRPSMMPHAAGGTPEAEIGLERVGLSALPFIAMGHLDWLAAQRGLEPQSLLKPSSVHVLAALRRAIGDTLVQALDGAARLGLDHVDDGLWRRLDGAHATVLDDSFRGLRSAREAQAALESIGVRVTLDLRGVTTLAAKQEALEAAGGVVYPDFVTAARPVLDRAT